MISMSRIESFILKNIVCPFGVPRILISDNGTQFTSNQVKNMCQNLGIKQGFSYVEHSQTNDQIEAANQVILREIKRRLETTKANWRDEVPRVLWSYHTTPQSTTRETPCNLVYGIDALIKVEIVEPTPHICNVFQKASEEGQRANLDLLEEVRKCVRVRVEALKRRVKLRYKSKAIPKQFKVVDLVMRKSQIIQMDNKLAPKCSGPYKI